MTRENKRGNTYLNFIKKKNICLLITAAVTVLSTLLHTLAVLISYEPERFNFENGSVLGFLSNLMLIIGAVALLSFAFVLKVKESSPAGISPCRPLTSFFSALSGGLAVVASAYAYIDRDMLDSKNRLTVMLILSFPTALYLILTALARKKRMTELTLFGIFPPLFFALCLFDVYFEVGGIMRDPVRVLSQMAFISVMLYFLSELRARAGLLLTGWYTATGALSVMLGTTYSVSTIVRRIADPTLGIVHRDGAMAVFMLITSAYIACRLIELGKGRNRSAVPEEKSNTEKINSSCGILEEASPEAESEDLPEIESAED